MTGWLQWLDGFPVWAVVLASFAAGSAVALVMRTARRSKYESKEA